MANPFSTKVFIYESDGWYIGIHRYRYSLTSRILEIISDAIYENMLEVNYKPKPLVIYHCGDITHQVYQIELDVSGSSGSSGINVRQIISKDVIVRYSVTFESLNDFEETFEIEWEYVTFSRRLYSDNW
jgi:hypothetical protein